MNNSLKYLDLSWPELCLQIFNRQVRKGDAKYAK